MLSSGDNNGGVAPRPPTVIFRIETIFVMDEQPFYKQRDKMAPLPGMTMEPNSGGKESKKSSKLKNQSSAKMQ